MTKPKENPKPWKGNKYNNKKYKYPEECKEAYKSYCAWIAQGNSKEAWCYESKTMDLSYKTMEKYIKQYPDDFPIIHMEKAQSQSLKIWEERGLTMMLGQLEKCQPAIFQMFMRNKFGWDKDNYGQKESSEPLIQKMAKIWRKE